MILLDYLTLFAIAVLVLWGLRWLALVATPVLWLVFCERYDPPYVVRDLVKRSTVRNVHFRVRDLRLHNFGFSSTPLPGVHLIVLDRRVVRYASTLQLLFVVGHELGHIRMGHTAFCGMVGRVTMAMLRLDLDSWDRGLLTRERAADEYSRLMTGIPRDVLYGIHVPGQGS